MIESEQKRQLMCLPSLIGIVEEVYNPVDRKYTEDPKHIGRSDILGVEDEHTTYIGKDVSAFYGKSQNPVKYINM